MYKNILKTKQKPKFGIQIDNLAFFKNRQYNQNFKNLVISLMLDT